jgi:DNA-binding CsgD family transcriptional regulator
LSTIIDLTEAAYDFEVSDDQWLRGLLERGLPVFEQGLGVAGYEYGRPPGGGDVTLLGMHVASGREDFADRHMRALSTTDPEVLRRQLRPGCATTGSDAVEEPGQEAELEHYLSHVDYCKDVLYITAVDPKGSGIAIVAPLEERTALTPRQARRWQMIASHVSAGHRLRRRLKRADWQQQHHTDLPFNAEAVLDGESLRPTELAGEAQKLDRPQSLREAALRLDRARGAMRRENPEKALEIWQALVRGRWSMVDWFDSDGRRLVLAIPNSPDLNDPRGLSARESQVVTYAAYGDTNKIIAYRLGLSRSRVSLLLRSAMEKLGIRTRVQLVQRMRAFQSLE